MTTGQQTGWTGQRADIGGGALMQPDGSAPKVAAVTGALMEQQDSLKILADTIELLSQRLQLLLRPPSPSPAETGGAREEFSPSWVSQHIEMAVIIHRQLTRQVRELIERLEV